MKILVAIASYGRKNDPYLARLLTEYRRMPHQVDLVVLSNLPKELGPEVEVVVGLPGKDPHTLPFAHRRIFGERRESYDLFIYCEDDILITERNLQAFLEVTRLLPEDELAGFVHADRDPEGTLYYDPPHEHFHWAADSLRQRGGLSFAQFTNEHSACFVLTREQLRRAIASGGFLVEPHRGRYNYACSASTDPYTQCGFRKMVCVSRLEDFTVLHLPNNKYAERPYRHASYFLRQVEALRQLEKDGRPRSTLFEAETKVRYSRWSKNYYEPVRTDMLALLPGEVKSVLSIGCGWGATEGWLVEQGIRVVALPLDSVIAACAAERGVEIVYGSFEEARQKLAGERFDCLLLSNVLHLVPEPVGLLRSFCELLASGGCVIASAPNFQQAPVLYRRLKRHAYCRGLGSFRESGITMTTLPALRRWLRAAGFSPDRVVSIVPSRFAGLDRLSLGAGARFLASEFILRSRVAGRLGALPQPARAETAAVAVSRGQ